MATILYPDEAGMVYVILGSNSPCLKNHWKLCCTTKNLELVEMKQFKYCEYLNHLKSSGGDINDIDDDYNEKILDLFTNYTTVQIWSFYVEGFDEIKESPILGELVFKRVKARKNCKAFQIRQRIYKDTCNKVDYKDVIPLYIFVWLSSDNVHYLDSLGLLNPEKLKDKECTIDIDGLIICWYTGKELRSDILKIMREAGHNPKDSKVDKICTAVANLIHIVGNPTNLDRGCGLYFSYGTYVKSKIKAQS